MNDSVLGDGALLETIVFLRQRKGPKICFGFLSLRCLTAQREEPSRRKVSMWGEEKEDLGGDVKWAQTQGGEKPKASLHNMGVSPSDLACWLRAEENQ